VPYLALSVGNATFQRWQ